MYDLAVENSAPGPCQKCKGSGEYRWGASVNGKMTNAGKCFSCKGTGQQDKKQIVCNRVYNRHKIAAMAFGA
jgi:DnaJ-class molecular chaperone